MEEENYICPNCKSGNTEIRNNNEKGDVDVITGSFAVPFYMYCNDCQYKWQLKSDCSDDEVRKEKTNAKTNAGLILILNYVLGFIAFYFLIFYILKNL